MRDITLGQYYPVKSLIHSLDARVKIILMIGCGLLVASGVIMLFYPHPIVRYSLIAIIIGVGFIKREQLIKHIMVFIETTKRKS